MERLKEYVGDIIEFIGELLVCILEIFGD